MKEKLEKFIKDNNLKFEVGTRNSDSTVISGYALHLGVRDTEPIIEAIESTLKSTADYEGELDRVFNYALRAGYGKFWKTKDAKKLYIF